ncbi:MAG: leucyl-tRNA synthetase [Candidatus Sumerlaeota bacterium]|nr:leucyl-tRNA synthetase [Candidatus Sumerlaeota bacterium]
MSQRIYDPVQVENKWRKFWADNGTNEIDLHAAKNPFYVLMMFPYPSAEGLHVGNVYAFTGADIQGRYRRLKGFDVFEPIGFDAFGIHSENFAMKINRHPRELIPSNIRNFTNQLTMMGLMYDWRRTVDTTTPEYYKWTQWVFLQLYKAGLAYRDEKEVNFCPECGTVIADEQVNADGTCERHGDTMVQRRRMPCWFFRITEFADRLASNHDWLDWSETTKTAQLNWIGRSTGAEVDFAVDGTSEKIRVFTTRPDTLFGATFMVLAPEHPLVDAITTPDKQQEVRAYQEAHKNQADSSAADSTSKEKTGVHTGAYAINPVNGQKIPIFIADYVMMGYGTGAIMAVPSGDHRDFEFAKEFDLPVVPIIEPDLSNASSDQLSGTPFIDPAADAEKERERIRAAVASGNAAWSGPGEMVNSANDEITLNGLPKEQAIATINAWLEKKGLGHAKKHFRLRDWGISRQRYWGPPIPILYDEDGNPHPVPEDQLPVTLPDIDDFRPKGDGRGPLASVPEWINVEIDGKKYRRETDVMDNFLDSAWYYLRYVSSNDDTQAYDPALVEKWLPVDMYVGGNEHAVLHLLYTRFICMALEKAGVLKMGARPEMKDRAEPFRKFRAHGLLVKDGAKMSKSKGNVINPDEFVARHGADTLRTYLMFLGPYTFGGDFRDKDIMGVRRFFNRVYDWFFGSQPIVADEALPKDVRVKLHQTIKKCEADFEALSYNTAVAALMELSNALRAAKATSAFAREAFCVMLAPFAPHLAEELWHEALGKEGSVFDAEWPKYDEALTVLDEIEIPIQVNGKMRDKIVVARGADQETIEKAALATAGVERQLQSGGAVRKIIVVPGRLVNVIVK